MSAFNNVSPKSTVRDSMSSPKSTNKYYKRWTNKNNQSESPTSSFKPNKVNTMLNHNRRNHKRHRKTHAKLASMKHMTNKEKKLYRFVPGFENGILDKSEHQESLFTEKPKSKWKLLSIFVSQFILPILKHYKLLDFAKTVIMRKFKKSTFKVEIS